MKALKRLGLLILLFAFSLPAACEAGGEDGSAGFLTAPSETGQDGFHRKGAQILGFFLLLGGFAYGAVYLQKKRSGPRGSTIRVVAVKPLGQKEKVAILEVLGERMVLGVTAHRISLLSQGPSRFSELMEEEETA